MSQRQRNLLSQPRSRFSPRALWLLFAQTVTVIIAVVFVTYAIQINFRANPHERNSNIASELTFRHALVEMLPSVVSVRTQSNDDAASVVDGGNVNLGSGVIVTTDGLIITNNHVVHKATSINVLTHGGERYAAEILGSDADIDIAILRIATDKPLKAVRFQSKRNPLRVGDIVISVGSPYGLVNTAALGIVSATGRSNLGLSKYEHFIQTDAAINHGSSGGALTNARGELVGINTALFSKQYNGNFAQGIGFAIPAELVHAAFREIVTHGRFRRGWVGMDLVHLEVEDADYGKLDALRVKHVVHGSPSEIAGVLPGDLVMAIDGRAPSEINYMEEATGQLLRPNYTLTLDLRRNDENITLELQVIEQ